MRSEKKSNYKSDIFISSKRGFQTILISASLAFLMGMCSLGDVLYSGGNLIKIPFTKIEKKFSVNLLKHLTLLTLKCKGFYDFDISIGTLDFREEELEDFFSDDMNFKTKNISSSNNTFWPINLNQLKSGTFYFVDILKLPVRSKFAEIELDFLRK